MVSVMNNCDKYLFLKCLIEYYIHVVHVLFIPKAKYIVISSFDNVLQSVFISKLCNIRKLIIDDCISYWSDNSIKEIKAV